jgi:integrase
MLDQMTITKLHELKLSAIAEAFRQKTQDPAYVGLSFEERFGPMLDIEWAKRKNNRLTRLIRQAAFSDTKVCIEDIDVANRIALYPISTFPQPQPFYAPVLVEPEQIGRMLTLTCRLTPTPGSPPRAAVLRLAIAMLYTAGLRRGELLHLSLQDVEPQTGVIRIHESKFHKSRFIPLSSDAISELCHYLGQRLSPPFDTRPASPLLCNLARGKMRPILGPVLARASTPLALSAQKKKARLKIERRAPYTAYRVHIMMV